jgi:hypothetical protein
MDNLLQGADDVMEFEPPEFGPLVTSVLTSSLAKQLADQFDKPWTDKHESDLQEHISTLVAAAHERGLKSIRVTITRPTGDKVLQEWAIDRISKTRSLQ